MNKHHRLLSLLIVTCCIFGSVRSHGFSLGLHGGVHLANTNAAGSQSQTQFMFGGRLELPIAFNLYFQPELNFLDFGGAEYLGVPLLGKVKIEGDGFSPYLFIGPEFGIKISGAAFNGSNFSIDFGGGLEFEVSDMTVVYLDARYSLGTTDIISGTTSKTRSVQILAGLAFGI